MNLSISFNPDDAADVNAAIATLHKFIDLEQRAATFRPVQLPAVALDKLDDPSVGAAPAAPVADAPKRGRPRKTEQPQQEVAAEAVGKPEVSSSAPSMDSSAPATTSLTLDDVRSALQKFTQKHSIEAGIELLEKFGAQRVSELPAEKYGEFVGACV